MLDVIIGNLCSVLALVTDSIASSRRTARGVLLMQTLSQVIYGLGSAVLGGYSAAAQNLVSLLRNLAAISQRSSEALKWALVALGVVLGILCNNLGLIGWLPIVANLVYSLVMLLIRDNDRALKLAFLFCNVMFTIFNVAIRNYVGAASNVAVFCTTVYFLVKQK